MLNAALVTSGRTIPLALLLGVLLPLMATAHAQSADDPWMIVTSGGKGPLNLHTTHEDLVRTFGATNVIEKDGTEEFSGDVEYVTVLFPKDTERSIEIRWRDAEKKAVPESMTARGGKSRWKTVHDISLGTSLKKLEELNGRPFSLNGFGWDYEGGVTSWEGGLLAADLDGGHGTVAIRFCSSMRNVSQEELAEVTGSGSFPSNHPVMQKLNLRACEVVWEFPSWEQRRPE
jgi:hypothetical protein